MKRSELKTQLLDLFYWTTTIDVPNHSFIEYEELVEEVMQLIEKSGLVPPKVTKTVESKIGNSLSTFKYKQRST